MSVQSATALAGRRVVLNDSATEFEIRSSADRKARERRSQRAEVRQRLNDAAAVLVGTEFVAVFADPGLDEDPYS